MLFLQRLKHVKPYCHSTIGHTIPHFRPYWSGFEFLVIAFPVKQEAVSLCFLDDDRQICGWFLMSQRNLGGQCLGVWDSSLCCRALRLPWPPVGVLRADFIAMNLLIRKPLKVVPGNRVCLGCFHKVE